MGRETESWNNAISTVPLVDSKNHPIEWTTNKKIAYDRMTAKKWARAIVKLPKINKGLVLKESESNQKKK